MMDYPEMLRRLRNASVADVARATGLSRAALYALMNGSRPDPRLSTLVALDRYFSSKDKQ